jgi:hypothetical protein
MIKVFFLIFEPSVAWDKIAQARRGILFITGTYLLPFLLLVTAVESWGLQRHGKWQPKFQKFREFQPQEILTYETVQFFLLFAVVFVCALLVFKISQTFHDRQKFLQSFTVVAYAFSPMLLFRLLDASATMHPAITWLLGMALTIWILYQGIPRVMQPDPTHAFGVYFSAVFVVVLTSALARLITGMYLLGYIDFHHSWLSRKVAHLLGQ